ncbi:hypothetical protein [Colwellia psychrerythraea]|uniref:hypothetical protein n=1 Tax=Colwellia psychrerythraea TaxID=28229 RepID=UPI00051A2157|nr:hypothetical protein [Colwellia psychrerythraea]
MAHIGRVKRNEGHKPDEVAQNNSSGRLADKRNIAERPIEVKTRKTGCTLKDHFNDRTMKSTNKRTNKLINKMLGKFKKKNINGGINATTMPYYHC